LAVAVASNLQLVLLMGPMVPMPVPPGLADALQSAQVTTATGRSSGFQLSFAVSKKSIIQTTLLPAGYFDPKIRVLLVAVVRGLPQVLMDGVITRQEVVPSNDPGAATLTVTGEDLSVLMDLRRESTSYPAMPRNLRAMAIIAKYAMYGMIPAAIPPLYTDVPNPLESIPNQSMSDLEYLRATANEVGYTFYIDPGPLPGANLAYWGPEIRIGVPQPALTIGMGAATNVESLSFSFDGLSRTQYTITITEPNSKLGIPVPVPDISLLHPPLALRPAVALKETPLPDIADRKTTEVLLLGMSRTSQSTDAITGQGKLDVLRYGHVLKARQLVGVRGAGLAYDGAYFVNSVTHDIKRGEYKQSFSLSRDGLISLTPVVV
jgi:hypothetical protein